MATTVANPQDVTTTAPGTLVDNNSQANVTNDNLPRPTVQQVAQTNAGLSSLLSQNAVRQAMPGIIVFLTVALFLLAYSWIQEPPYKAVYPGMSEADRQLAFTELTSADFRAQIDSSTGELKVPSDRYHEARLLLASRGLPQGAASGGIISLSDDSAITTSQFMEQVRYTAAIENELARSISQINSIQSARVHLASPKESVFVRNRTPAKASVVVTPFPGRIVSSSQVQAIVHMVSSSVPYLSAEGVSVVDNRGKLLTDTPQFSSMQLNGEQMAHKIQMEDNLRNRIDSILSPVVGIGNVRSEVDIQIDFTETESTFEDYDGNNAGPLARSEILNIEQKPIGGEASGIPGAASNTSPIASGEGGQSTTNTTSSQTTRNYEMDREIRYVRNTGAKVEKISVAVVINANARTSSVTDETDSSDAGFSQEELDRFSNLIKGVVGFDEERGDNIEMVAIAFDEPEMLEEAIIPWYSNNQILNIIKIIFGSIIFIVFLFFVVRPAIKNYSNLSGNAGTWAGKDGELTAAEISRLNSGDSSSIQDIKAKLKPKRSGLTADMLDTANTYDDKVALVRLLVAEDSGRVANVLKKMIRP
ncbi:MAG: flagellar M-ring protein FliF [Porticoccaceae bacterium]|nr:flagellar M-ring protein FliF [Porticoccaceae bacterium]